MLEPAFEPRLSDSELMSLPTILYVYPHPPKKTLEVIKYLIIILVLKNQYLLGI